MANPTDLMTYSAQFTKYHDWYLTYRYYKESNRDQVMATRYPLSALAFPCVTMLWLSSQMSVSLTTAADSKHMAILNNVNCTLSSSCITDQKITDKFYRLVLIAETIMEETRPSTSNKLRNSSNSYNNRRDRNVLYPETPVNTTNSSIMLFRMDEQIFTGEQVTSAVLKIYIKTRGKRRRRRIILHVSENTAEGQLAEFATIKLRVKRKGWQKINLPVYLLNKLQHQPIKLHVGCEKCNKKVRVVLPLKKSKKSQEFRDLGSRKRRSPIIVLNTKPNYDAAAAAVAAAVATSRLRRPRRDIFRFGSRDPVPEAAGPKVGQTAAEINTDSSSAKHLRPSLTNIGGVGKSPTIVQRKDRGLQDVDEGAPNVPKRRETTRSTRAERGVTQVNNNIENENKSSAGNNYDYSIDGYDDDDDDSSSFDDDDDNDDDGDSDDDEEAEEEEEDEKKALGYNIANAMEKYEGEHVSGEKNGREEDEDEGLNNGCCMRSRFVSFRSIGLSGLVVRPRLGFVSNECSDLCPTDRLYVTPPARADFGNSGTVEYLNKPQKVADFGPSEYTDQPKPWSRPFEENSRKSLLDKLTNSPNPRFSSEQLRVRPSFPLLPHLRQIKRQHPFRDRNHRIDYGHHNGHHEGQQNYDKRRANDVNNKNGNNSKKRVKERDSHKKMKKKNLPPRRLCLPVEYKNLKLSFITADMKVEQMTLPDAIVSKCGYV